MSEKKDEALKLALEALENLPEMCGIEEAITAVQEALAEQPAQGCEFCSHPLYAGTKCKNCGREQPAQQQEPLAVYVGETWCGSVVRLYEELPLETPLYTSPPASKPWVGLTDEEMRDLEKQFNAERVRTSDEEYLIIYPSAYWAWQRAIEAKLREKNAPQQSKEDA